MDIAETLEGGQFDHSLDMPLKQDRQHDNIWRRCFTKPGTDLDVAWGNLRKKDALLFERTLSNQPFTGFKPAGDVLAFAIRVAGKQLHIRFAVFRAYIDVKNTMLCRYERGKLSENQLGYGKQIALSLQQPREVRKVRLQPILCRILLGCLA